MNTVERSEHTAQYIIDLCSTPKLTTSCALVHFPLTRKARGTSCVRNWTNSRSDGTPPPPPYIRGWRNASEFKISVFA